MRKDRDSYKYYEDCVKDNLNFFKSYYYHSVLDLNLVKFARILEDGILSRKELDGSCLYTEELNSYSCKNGENWISISKCIGSFPLSNIFEGFTLHTLSSPSIMINKNIRVCHEVQNGAGFDDELFVFGEVSEENFEGILVPEHLQHQLIKDIDPVFHHRVCMKREYITNWIYLLENYFSAKIDNHKLLSMVDELNEFSKKYYEKHYSANIAALSSLDEQKRCHGEDLKEVMASIIQELWNEELGYEDVKYIDVINHINSEKLPVYVLKRDGVIRVNEKN